MQHTVTMTVEEWAEVEKKLERMKALEHREGRIVAADAEVQRLTLELSDYYDWQVQLCRIVGSHSSCMVDITNRCEKTRDELAIAKSEREEWRVQCANRSAEVNAMKSQLDVVQKANAAWVEELEAVKRMSVNTQRFEAKEDEIRRLEGQVSALNWKLQKLRSNLAVCFDLAAPKPLDCTERTPTGSPVLSGNARNEAT